MNLLFLFDLTRLGIIIPLSLARDKFRLINVDLNISEYIIDEVCKSIGRFRTGYSDATNK